MNEGENMFTPTKFTVPQSPPPQELRLGSDAQTRLDGGISYKYVESQLDDNQSPYMLNMNSDDRGSLTKRLGQSNVYSSSLGVGGINGTFRRPYLGNKVFAWGTALYTQSGNAQPVQIMSGLANAKGTFFVFNSILYYINGTNFVQYDGATAQNVVGYIPTLTLGRAPTGGGTPNEALNQIQPGFKDSFTAPGATTAYQLSQTGLDATLVTAVVNGVAKVETTDFTVNRATGVVTFTVAPAAGTANNVVLTAYKTNAGFLNKILNCTIVEMFGTDNDTRVFLTGNTNFKNRIFRSGLSDPTYWPADTFQNVGTDFEAIYGLAKHFDRLIILKEKSLYFSVYSSNPVTPFPTAPLNSAVGCNITGSIQIIDNNVVFGNTETGLYILVSTVVKDERVVRPISGNINGTTLRPGLLSLLKSDLQNASSLDDGGKYWLCVGNVAYVWDYKLSPFVNTGNLAQDEEHLSWFPYTNINAACWINYDQLTFYGDRTNGNLVTFIGNYNDFGQPINGIWRSKLFNFNLPDYLKTITEVWFTTRAASYSSISIKYINDNGEVVDSATVNTSSFSWAHFAWNQFSWSVSKFAPTIRTKPKIKKVVYFQLEFSNAQLNQNLSILSLIIKYLTVRKVK
jgi:hypothetical protein